MENQTKIKFFKIENGDEGLQKAENEINNFIKRVPLHNWPMIQLYSGRAIVIYQGELLPEEPNQ